MKKFLLAACAFFMVVLIGSLNAFANPELTHTQDNGKVCQSKQGITAYISIFKDNKCCAYFKNSTSKDVEVNWTITGIEKETGERVEVASGRSTIKAGKTGNTCDTYFCGGSDYRDGSYSVSFDLCD